MSTTMSDPALVNSDQKSKTASSVVEDKATIRPFDCDRQVRETPRVTAQDDICRHIVATLSDTLTYPRERNECIVEPHEDQGQFVPGRLRASHDTQLAVSRYRGFHRETLATLNERPTLECRDPSRSHHKRRLVSKVDRKLPRNRVGIDNFYSVTDMEPFNEGRPAGAVGPCEHPKLRAARQSERITVSGPSTLIRTSCLVPSGLCRISSPSGVVSSRV
jgi:hypothetical protein